MLIALKKRGGGMIPSQVHILVDPRGTHTSPLGWVGGCAALNIRILHIIYYNAVVGGLIKLTGGEAWFCLLFWESRPEMK